MRTYWRSSLFWSAGLLAVMGTLAQAGEEGLVGAIAIASQKGAEAVPVVLREYRVVKSTKPIAIDGRLDDWEAAGIEGRAISGKEHISWFEGQYGGSQDLSATFYLTRDHQFLYLAVAVTDDVPQRGDSLEVSFDTLNNDKIIREWRDVGRRYDNDDYHYVIAPTDDGGRASWRHRPRGLGRDILRLVECKVARKPDAKGYVYEVAFPWLALTPYIPTRYSPMKFNVAVNDRDEERKSGAVAWTPGLVWTYSAGHFGSLRFEPGKASPGGLEAYLIVPGTSFTAQTIPVRAGFYNYGGERKECVLQAGAKTEDGKAVHTEEVEFDMPAGSGEALVKMDSEKLGKGDFSFTGKLVLPGGKALPLKVQTFRASGTVFVQSVEEVKERIARLREQSAELSRLHERIVAKGLHPAYPRMFKTLFEMFIPRCEQDLKNRDSARVLMNCGFLDGLFPKCKAYLELILKEPDRQVVGPDAIVPDKLKIKKGYYWFRGKPVFLWGPGVFWYVRDQLKWVAGLGFNSQQIGDEHTRPEAREYLDQCYKLGVANNANITWTGGWTIGRKHPETANRDPNVFTPFIIHHPIVRQELRDWFGRVVPLFSGHPSVISYVLINEPWYTNYGELTRRSFIDGYLKPKYRTVSALNERWRADYAGFEDVKLATWIDLQNHAPWYDFQRFRDDLLFDYLDLMRECVKKIAPQTPIHYKFMAMSLQSFDIERFHEKAEIIGYDGNMTDRDVPYMDFAKSLWPGRPLVNTEVHIAYGSQKMLENVAWRHALHGLADGNWWCWHTNPRFSNALGKAEVLYGLAKSGLDVQRLFHPYLYALNREPKPIATLFPDVIERRSDKSIVRIRYEVMAVQYPLGIQPFYATERRIAKGELPKHRLLFAPESEFVSDRTYKEVVDYVKDGGRVILAPGGFAHDEWGDPRNTSAFIRPSTGAPLCEGITVYPFGKGEVICMNDAEAVVELKTDGSEVCAGSASQENVRRRKIYCRTLRAAMKRYSLTDTIEVAVKDTPEDSVPSGLDWRYAKVGRKHILAVVYHGWGKRPPLECELRSALPVTGVTDLINRARLPVHPLFVTYGPHLYEVEIGGKKPLATRRDDASGTQTGGAQEHEELMRLHEDLIFQP